MQNGKFVPVGQRQLGKPPLVKQKPLFWHGFGEQVKPSSHSVPVNCGRHVHVPVNSPVVWQEPPFKQGFGVQKAD